MNLFTSNVYYPKIMESLENRPLSIHGNDAFCKTHQGYNLETSCNSLTKSNCNGTSCCSWIYNTCKAQNKSGTLLFNSNANNKRI